MNKQFTICNLRFWRAGNWIQYETKCLNLSMRIHIDQLLITSDDKVIETLNMNAKIKGVYKEDVLVLVVTENLEARKIKFQIKSNAVQILRQLGQHFPVTKYKSSRFNKNIKYRNIDEHFQIALNKLVNENSNLPLPKTYNDFIKLCLLDPLFPSVVIETQNILNDEVFKNNCD